MEKLPYKIIKSKRQYYDYCNVLEELVMIQKKSKEHQDTIELLTLLIEKYDEEHNSYADADPIELLRFLMKENSLKSIDLANLIGISASLVSDILNYRRGLSKEIIRKLAERFKVTQELFNRPYKLVKPVKAGPKETGRLKHKKLQKTS